MIKFKNQNGFSLFEMIVAIGVFTFVITIGLETVLQFKNIQRKAAAVSQIQENIRFALEHMAREMRMANNTTFQCNLCDSGTSDQIEFTNNYNQNVVYRLNGSRIEKSVDGGLIFSPITSSNVGIESLDFFLSGETSGDNLQPKIRIYLKSLIKQKNEDIRFDLQTLVSLRALDT